ncbi:MAG: ATP-dependent sacrificial sulfur transferase LarE [Deltaproteobacteria bacterium]|nr:ATP-dependent sacrificial sulfur transferase LarE [Deltaproteobacteria bacterium]
MTPDRNAVASFAVPGDASANFPADASVKQDALLARLASAGRLLVAFSGGVDSSYLAWAAKRALGEDSLCVTAVSPSYPESHRAMAEKLVADFGLAHRFVETHEMERPAYRANASDRCYHCKSELFETLDDLARELRFDHIAYGINTDDTSDFRPGHRAAREHDVLAPFLEVGLSKQEIRALSRAAGLPTADLPASACLSSRLPYGTEVTVERLHQVEAGEERLRGLGFRQVRLRHHGELARIEIDPGELPRALDPAMAKRMVDALKPLGFRYVSLDLEGYRMGSLNEVLQIQREPIR